MLVFKYYYHIIGQCRLETHTRESLISTEQNEGTLNANKCLDDFFFLS